MAGVMLRNALSTIPLITAGFVSGYTLGWMLTDNEKSRQFRKYHLIPLNVSSHTYYVYARDQLEYERCVGELESKGLLR